MFSAIPCDKKLVQLSAENQSVKNSGEGFAFRKKNLFDVLLQKLILQQLPIRSSSR